MNNIKSKNPLHLFSLGLVCATLVLIFVGGLVTSTHSGLSVPDWPLSYGKLMPPMVGGILFEHGHRMVAATVGFLTVLLALFFTWKSDQTWLKKAAWVAVSLVVFQGVLGGLTVLLRLPKPISILHACTAQTFFCLVVSLAVWTSNFWNNPVPARMEPQGKHPLHQIAWALFGAAFLQLILGALIRHTGFGVRLHIADAGVVLFLSLWSLRRVWLDHKDFYWLKIISLFLCGAILLQIILGVSTYLILGYQFYVIPIPFFATLVITSHVMTGALVLGSCLVFAFVTTKSKPLHTLPLKTKLSDYYELTKPGISFMAGITALAGFVLGSKGEIDFLKLIHTGLGTLLVAASAGILNMLIEKDIDAKMNRTKKRPLPSGRMHPGEALFLGTLAAIVGILYLSWSVNILTAFLAGLTLSVYLYIYTPLKKVSSICTPVGAFAGALPPAMGWAAATGRVGIESVVLFGIIFFWQFPHFFSLAWLYKDDYARAGLHMLPRLHDKGTTTAVSMMINSVALFFVSLLPTYFGMTGLIYLVTAIALGLWISITSFYFLLDHSTSHAKRVFLASILYVPILVIAMMAHKFAY